TGEPAPPSVASHAKETPTNTWQPSRRAIVISGLIGAAALVAVGAWLASKPAALTPQPLPQLSQTPSPPPSPPAPPAGTIAVFRCEHAPPDLADAYGIGVLTTHPQFCASTEWSEAPREVSTAVAAKTELPARGPAIFVCKQFAASLKAAYGIGILT